jgi:hypothetical protein
MYRSICKWFFAVSLWIAGGANLCGAQSPQDQSPKEIINNNGMKLVLIPKGSYDQPGLLPWSV